MKGNKIISAGVILPLSRQGISRYGTRHLAALGITERFDRCICIVVSEETGTLSLANQGKLERPITSSRLQELLVNLIGNQNSMGTNKSSLGKNSLSLTSLVILSLGFCFCDKAVLLREGLLDPIEF